MKTLSEISNLLRQTMKSRRQTQAQLREAAGITQRTLTNVLSGKQDFKVTTLLAVADRLGLELMLVPKAAARGLTPGPDSPAVLTLVQQGRTAIRQPPRPAGTAMQINPVDADSTSEKDDSHGS